MKSKLHAFRRTHEMGEGYTIKPCEKNGHVLLTQRSENADQFFGCYEAVIQAGLRFPVHPAINSIIADYDIGLCQLTPNSWFNVLGYIVGCELHGVHPSFAAFAHMHYMTRAPYGDSWQC